MQGHLAARAGLVRLSVLMWVIKKNCESEREAESQGTSDSSGNI